jgi:hypothetical protein
MTPPGGAAARCPSGRERLDGCCPHPHLGLAIDRSERCRSNAQDDSDFDPIRDEPAFKELIERKG